MNRFFQRGWLGLPLLAPMVLTVCVARGGAYLPWAGPPPLRFAAAPHAKFFSWRPPALPAIQTNPPPASSLQPLEKGGNPAVPPPSASEKTVPNLNLPSAGAAEVPTNSLPAENVPASPPNAANNLLNVSPEMLLDYFQSTDALSDSTNARAPERVIFVPPLPFPAISSQATYESR